MDKYLYNIHILGIGFMFLYSAVFTTASIQPTVFQDFNKHGVDAKTGFYSIAIIFGSATFGIVFAPVIVHKLGSKLSLFLSSLPYVGMIFSMYEPYLIAVYLLSAIVGLCASVLWTANGQVLARNSPGDTNSRNAGIFWSWYMSGMLLGNIFVYFYLGKSVSVTDDERHMIFLILGSVCALGALCLLFIAPIDTNSSLANSIQSSNFIHSGILHSVSLDIPIDVNHLVDSALQPIKDALKLCRSWQMCYLYGPMIFTGVSQCFNTSVFVTCIGAVFTPRSYLALTGICMGAGEICGGLIWGRISNKIKRGGVVMVCTVLYCIIFYLVFISFPYDAVTGGYPAQDLPYIQSNIYLALVLALFIGIADAGFNISLMSALGSIFEDTPGPAFAILQLVQCIVTAGAFLYCGHLLLPFQLLILTVSCLVGCVCFFTLERYQ